MKRLIFRAEIPTKATYQIMFGLLDDETCMIDLVSYNDLMNIGFVINLRWENMIAKMVDSINGLPYIGLADYNRDIVYYALEMQDDSLVKLVSNTGKVYVMSWNVLPDWLFVGAKSVSNMETTGGFKINTAVAHTTALRRSLKHARTK